MFKDFFFICSEIWKNKSVLRAYLNLRLKKDILRGNTIDIGGGKNADYISFMKKEQGVQFKTFDLKKTIGVKISKKESFDINDKADLLYADQFLNKKKK